MAFRGGPPLTDGWFHEASFLTFLSFNFENWEVELNDAVCFCVVKIPTVLPFVVCPCTVSPTHSLNKAVSVFSYLSMSLLEVEISKNKFSWWPFALKKPATNLT